MGARMKMIRENLGHYWRVGVASRSLTGFMHDAVEDGWWPKWAMWPALDAITRREGETYAAYIDRVAANVTATIVKRADLRDNMTRNGGPPDSLKMRYINALARLKRGEMRRP